MFEPAHIFEKKYGQILVMRYYLLYYSYIFDI